MGFEHRPTTDRVFHGRVIIRVSERTSQGRKFSRRLIVPLVLHRGNRCFRGVIDVSSKMMDEGLQALRV